MRRFELQVRLGRLSDLTQLKPGTEHEVVAVGVLFKDRKPFLFMGSQHMLEPSDSPSHAPQDLKQRPNIIEEPLTARDRRRPLSLRYKGSKGLLNDWKAVGRGAWGPRRVARRSPRSCTALRTPCGWRTV